MIYLYVNITYHKRKTHTVYNRSNYSSVNGVLFNKDKTLLIKCPEGKIEYTIPDSTITVGESAFAECRFLASVTIGNSVRTIGKEAFCKCESLTSVTFPDSVKRISNNAFLLCKLLRSITINKGADVCYEAFGDCKFFDFNGKKEIKNLSKLPGYRYFGESYSKLIRYNIHNVLFDVKGGSINIEGIDANEGESFILPEYTGTKTTQTFAGWSYDGRIYQPGETAIKVNSDMKFTAKWVSGPTFKVDEINYREISGTSIEITSCDRSITGSVAIPSSIVYDNKTYTVVSICKSAFSGCKSLLSVTIPNSVKSISSFAFYNCKSLTSVTIDFGVSSIGNYAFAECRSMTSITIPDSIISIGKNAFQGCKFYDSDSKTVIKNQSKLPGYSYLGESPSKLIKHTLHNVLFDADGGSVKTEGMFVKAGENFILPNYIGVKTNYIFTGWSYNGKTYNAGDTVTKVSGDMKFTAKWTSTSFKVDGINYTGLPHTTVSVTGCDKSKSGNIVVPSSIRYDGKTYTVGSIGESAFSGCIFLTSVTVSENIKSISRCAFIDCKALASVTLPNTISSIGELAFAGCTSLATVVLPKSIRSIDYATFDECTSLTSMIIPGNVAIIGDLAFKGCTSLTSVKICDGTTHMYRGVFKDCKALKSVNIPSSTVSIDRTIFRGCISLSTVAADGVASLDDKLFKDSKSLAAVTIGGEVKSIGKNTLLMCKTLAEINVSAENNYYRSVNGVLFNKDMTTLIQYPACKTEQSYTIPDSVTSIADHAFYGCKSLTSVKIGNNVTSIDHNAFDGCKSLKSVTIPNSVKSIGKNAFKNCKFYDYDGKRKIKNNLDLTGYTYSGKSPSKLIRLCNVHFNKNGGSVNIKGMFIKEGEKITLPEYTGTKKDRYFTGWSYNKIVYLPGQNVTKSSEDMRFTAVWAVSTTFRIDGINYKEVSSTAVKVIGYSGSKIDLVIPLSVTNCGKVYDVISIGSYAFKGGKSLTSMTIPDSVTSIGDHAFDGCKSLTSVKFGSGITSLNSSLFKGLESLTGIEISKENSKYSSVNGLLLNKDKTVFIQCPEGKIECIIPDSVISIGEFAFYKCKSLTSIMIPSSVTSINHNAFDGCKSLKSVTIPNNVKSISKDAFKDCKFYDYDGKTKIKNNLDLPGYTYSGESSSKLIRSGIFTSI